jgi:hypothetical protein
MAMEPNTIWKSEIVHSHPLLTVLIDNNHGVEMRYNNGTPVYSRLGEIESFQVERYYSIKSTLTIKNPTSSSIKVYKVNNTNFEIVEDPKLEYLKVLDISDSNQVVYVQKIFKQ